jgi:hypothetical protein
MCFHHPINILILIFESCVPETDTPIHRSEPTEFEAVGELRSGGCGCDERVLSLLAMMLLCYGAAAAPPPLVLLLPWGDDGPSYPTACLTCLLAIAWIADVM